MKHDDIGASIKTYRDLSEASVFLYRWLPDFTFEIDPISKEECDSLSNTSGLEVHITSPHWDHIGFIADLLSKVGRTVDLFLLEHKSKPKSALRSYKGVFFDQPAIRAGDHVEVEASVASAYTHIVGIARLTPANVREALTLIGDSSRAFLVLSSSAQALSPAVGKRVLGWVPRLPGPAYLNYAPIVAAFSSEHCWVLRLGGYSGEGDVFVQVFMPRFELAAAEQAARDTVTAAQI